MGVTAASRPLPADATGASMSIDGTLRVTPPPYHSLSPASRRISASSCWMIFLLSSLPLAAQQPTKDLGEASLEELGNIQVYSASKHLQRASDAPSSVTVITADEIQK
jgi:hypothetical protein